MHNFTFLSRLCTTCGSKESTERKQIITNSPRWLILHLKRFEHLPKLTKNSQQVHIERLVCEMYWCGDTNELECV